MPGPIKPSILTSSGSMLMSLYMTSCAANRQFQEHGTVRYTPELTETHLTITGKATNANFVNMDSIYIENYRALDREWGGIEMPRGFHSAELDNTQAYTYDIYRQWRVRHFEGRPVGENDRVATAIFRIKLGDKVIFDGSKCELHHCKMKRACVSLEDSDLNPKYQNAKSLHFPNAWSAKNNGDYVVWLCPDCVNAEKQWRLQP